MTYRPRLGNLAALLLFLVPLSAAEPDFATLNEAVGLPIWADDNLWDDPDVQVVQRLQWPVESRTTSDMSSRLYPGADARVLGARPYSLAFYGKDGHADGLSMVFANKGDLGGAVNYKKQIGVDAKAIEEALSRILGAPSTDRFGQGVRTREHVDRWDWKGHTIFLAAPRGEYVAARIVPTASADQSSDLRVSDAEIAMRLKARVEHRPNGDVVLKDIPMVDQGPKGYCVPATWERALRYMGIPADMYVLAMAAQTDAGGGTYTSSMIGAVNELISRNGRRLVTTGGRMTTRSISRFIDQGMPILWGMYVVGDLEKSISIRTALRRNITDWTAYRKILQPFKRDAHRIRIDRENAHVCMIIGYNPDTGELAISDSWGPRYAERWITEEEANAISQGELTIIGK